MMLQNTEFIEDDRQQDKLDKQRMTLLELKAQLRDAELETEGEIIANLNLKQVLEKETELYQEKNLRQGDVFVELETDMDETKYISERFMNQIEED